MPVSVSVAIFGVLCMVLTLLFQICCCWIVGIGLRSSKRQLNRRYKRDDGRLEKVL